MATKITPSAMRAIIREAEAASHKAATDCMPVPMVVYERGGLDGTSPIKKVYEPVMDGVCGFAEIIVHPATTRFARYLKAHYGETYRGQPLMAHIGYYGGLTLWVCDYNQSMTRKAAYADAYAAVLVENGLKAYGTSRMD
jgi:hypothetical protein